MSRVSGFSPKTFRTEKKLFRSNSSSGRGSPPGEDERPGDVQDAAPGRFFSSGPVQPGQPRPQDFRPGAGRTSSPSRTNRLPSPRVTRLVSMPMRRGPRRSSSDDDLSFPVEPQGVGVLVGQDDPAFSSRRGHPAGFGPEVAGEIPEGMNRPARLFSSRETMVFKWLERNEGMEEERGDSVPDDPHPFRGPQDGSGIGVADVDIAQVFGDDGHAEFTEPHGIRETAVASRPARRS